MRLLSSQPLAAAAVLLSAAVSSVSGDVISFCPQNAGGSVCYNVAVPSSSASKGSGNIYIQISAPTSFSWVALGTGGQMLNSNMFIVYQDGKGNLTVSPRRGTFHSTPQQDTSSSAAKLTLLAGSGVSNGQMVANFACSNCQKWAGGSMSLSDSSTAWIAAWRQGSSLSTTNKNANIEQHDGQSQFALDLTKAQISSDSNPYVSSGGGSSSGSGTGSGSGSGTVSGSGGGRGSSSGVVVQAGPDGSLLTVHGLVMALVFVVLYPLGSVLMPLLGKWIVHGVWQTISFILMWAGFALGVVCANQRKLLFQYEAKNHTILGTVVVAALAIQPLMGYLHHRHYVTHQSRGVISYFHIYWGRGLMALGVINGGLGLQIVGASTSIVVAYAVIAAIVFVAYVVTKSITSFRRRVHVGGSKELGHASPQEASMPPRRPYQDERDARRERGFPESRREQYRGNGQERNYAQYS